MSKDISYNDTFATYGHRRRTGALLEVNNYYPYGMLMGQPAEPQLQPHKYTGKEFEPTAGLNWLDFHARWYDPALLRTSTQDPMAEKYYPVSPYLWCAANPVKYIDFDGKKIVLSGDEKDKAQHQLDQKTNLILTQGKNGEILAKGTPKTEIDKLMLRIINDENIIVNLNATDNNSLIGGSFMGNEVVEQTTHASQVVNPIQLSTIDNFYEMPNGTSIFHELIEAYFGGQESPNSPPATGITDSNGNSIATSEEYLKAHEKAKNADPAFIEPDFVRDPNSNEIWLYKLNQQNKPEERKLNQ